MPLGFFFFKPMFIFSLFTYFYMPSSVFVFFQSWCSHSQVLWTTLLLFPCPSVGDNTLDVPMPKYWGQHSCCSHAQMLEATLLLFPCPSVMDNTLAVLVPKCWGQHSWRFHAQVLGTTLLMFPCLSVWDNTWNSTFFIAILNGTCILCSLGGKLCCG